MPVFTGNLQLENQRHWDARVQLKVPHEQRNVRVRDVARGVSDVIKTCMEQDGGKWSIVGNIHIRFEDLVLLELEHVAEGRYQPVLAVHNNVGEPA